MSTGDAGHDAGSNQIPESDSSGRPAVNAGMPDPNADKSADRSDRIRTCGILLPKQARYQLRYTPSYILYHVSIHLSSILNIKNLYILYNDIPIQQRVHSEQKSDQNH